MTISLNEIRKRASVFSKEWEGEKNERAEAQTFWNEFFEVFGISRRRVASFEHPAIKTDGGKGRIDLFWKGILVVEHKSVGAKLDEAYSQATDYFAKFDENELPKYVVVSDFNRFRLYYMEENARFLEFKLEDLNNNIHLFNFISGHERVAYREEDPVNIKAAEFMGELHDSLKNNGYIGHDLEMFLVRILFCLFADDTGIFPKDVFREYIEKNTSDDGSDIGSKLITLFEILNTPDSQRQKNIDEYMNKYIY